MTSKTGKWENNRQHENKKREGKTEKEILQEKSSNAAWKHSIFHDTDMTIAFQITSQVCAMLTTVLPVNLDSHSRKQQTGQSINCDRWLFHTNGAFAYSKSPSKAPAQKWHASLQLFENEPRCLKAHCDRMWLCSAICLYIPSNTLYFIILSVIIMLMMPVQWM